MEQGAHTIPYYNGQRYISAKDRQPLTLRYIGPLIDSGEANATPIDKPETIWLGVEWDDPKRGKHSGEYGGEQRYRVRQPGAGSFLRYRPRNPSKGKEVEPALFPGPTLWDAIQGKYLTGVVASDNSAVKSSNRGTYREIEVPNIDKVAKRLETEVREGRLRMLDLAGSWLRGRGHGERPSAIDLSSVQVLDVSQNLMNSWEALAGVTVEMPSLRILIMNHSRLPPLTQPLALSDNSLSRLRELHIRNSALAWSDAVCLADLLPELQILDVGSNEMIGGSLVVDEGGSLPLIHATLRELDLSCCRVGGDNGWRSLMDAISGCKSLHALYLSSNPLTRIPEFLTTPTAAPTSHIRSLVLFPTEIRSWSSMDNLARWCPALTELKLYPAPSASSQSPTTRETGSPSIGDTQKPATPWASIDGDFSGDMTGGREDRAWMIAKLKGLTMLNGTEVSKQERIDSERAYVRKVSGMKGVSEEVKHGFGRYVELSAEYQDVTANTKAQSTIKRDLKSRMIRFNVVDLNGEAPPNSIELLPSLPLKLIPAKLARLLHGQESNTRLSRTSELRWDWGETEVEAREKWAGVTEGDNGMDRESVGKLEDLVGWAMGHGDRSNGGEEAWWIVVDVR